jgi:hypothetical protein
MLAILCTKFHYSIDVFLAFYLCRTMFENYHQAVFLMGKYSLMDSDAKDPFYRVVQYLEKTADNVNDDDDDDDDGKLRTDNDSSSSKLLTVAMIIAGCCTIFVFHQGFVANSDYNQNEGKYGSPDNFKDKMSSINQCVLNCF